MNPSETEQALGEMRSDFTLLADKVRLIEEAATAHETRQRAVFDAMQRNSDGSFIRLLRLTFQFQALKEILLESGDKLGLSSDQMEAEYDRRWKTLLDANLRKLEDSNQNLAGSVDDRTEDEIPLDE